MPAEETYCHPNLLQYPRNPTKMQVLLCVPHCAICKNVTNLMAIILTTETFNQITDSDESYSGSGDVICFQRAEGFGAPEASARNVIGHHFGPVGRRGLRHPALLSQPVPALLTERRLAPSQIKIFRADVFLRAMQHGHRARVAEPWFARVTRIEIKRAVDDLVEWFVRMAEHDDVRTLAVDLAAYGFRRAMDVHDVMHEEFPVAEFYDFG